jgi:hypothetical protein
MGMMSYDYDLYLFIFGLKSESKDKWGLKHYNIQMSQHSKIAISDITLLIEIIN